MVRKYKKKIDGARKNYANCEEMSKAYNSVMKGEMSSNQAAKYYGVSKKSLLRRVRGEIPVDAHVGRQCVLSPGQEDELAECLILFADWGWGFNKAEVKDLIQDFCNHKHIETPFTENRPGRDWLERFLRDHPTIAPRKTEQLSSARARAQDPDVLRDWFNLLDRELTKAGVKTLPSQIFNVDESGFVTDPRTDTVLARKGAKRVNQAIGGSGREQVTVNCGGSAAGLVLSPFVVYKGKNLYHDWTQGGPENTTYTTSEKGWMEGQQFADWFKKIFLRETEHLKHNTRVLICDGHASHITLSLINEARNNNVVILRLPAHLTHLLQPFDRSVFRPVKLCWQQLLREYARTHNGPVSKKYFPGLLKKLYAKSFTADQVKSGFRACGIFPFNPSAVPMEELQPSPFVTRRPEVPVMDKSPTSELNTQSISAVAVPHDQSQCSPTSIPDSSHNASSSQIETPIQVNRPKSIRDFFLERLQPRFSGDDRGRARSARIQRFRYGESLTGDECLARLNEDAAKKLTSSKCGKGRGRGGTSCNRSRSPVRVASASTSYEEVDDDIPCNKCGKLGGERWVSCDICDQWYHMDCVELVCSLAEVQNMDWMCDNCTQ